MGSQKLYLFLGGGVCKSGLSQGCCHMTKAITERRVEMAPCPRAVRGVQGLMLSLL